MDNSFACGFQPRLFAAPEIEKRRRSLARRQASESGCFAYGEKAGDQFVEIGEVADAFQVDAERPQPGDAEQSQAFGVSEVEVHGGAGRMPALQVYRILGATLGGRLGAGAVVVKERGGGLFWVKTQKKGAQTAARK